MRWARKAGSSKPEVIDGKAGAGRRRCIHPRGDVQRVFDHADCGVLAVVTNAGQVAVGDNATLAPI